jgi:hypothetical protein
MSNQLIIPEVYNHAVKRLIKAEILNEIMLDLNSEYEKILSSTIVTQYKCNSISKILKQAYCYRMHEDFLLSQLNLSKRMYNKTLHAAKHDLI